MPTYQHIQREEKEMKARVLKVSERIKDGSRKEQRLLEIPNCWTKKGRGEYDMEKIKERERLIKINGQKKNSNK